MPSPFRDWIVLSTNTSNTHGSSKFRTQRLGCALTTHRFTWTVAPPPATPSLAVVAVLLRFVNFGARVASRSAGCLSAGGPPCGRK